MLNENIRNARISKGLSQDELAIKLNVVRQTISKWERGLSVPDSDMLISISEVLDTPVHILLGSSIPKQEAEPLKVISERLEIINLQLAQSRALKLRVLHWLFIALCVATAMIFAFLIMLNSEYLGWDYSDPETSVVGVGLHAIEWIYMRVAPFVFAGSILGIVLTRKRR